MRAVGGELAQDLISAQLAHNDGEPMPAWDELRAGFAAYLDACLDSDFQRIVLIDGPAVLGPEAWDALVDQHGLGLLRDWLHQAIDGGQIDPLPIDPLEGLLAALVAEASLYIARAANPARPASRPATPSTASCSACARAPTRTCLRIAAAAFAVLSVAPAIATATTVS